MTNTLPGKIMNLSLLSDPFPLEDIEWRVARSGLSSGKGIFVLVIAYITARAIQQRLDDVCGPANWRLEPPQILSINGKSAFSCGISIRLDGEWITKWDVAEPTNIEPAKGGFSGAMKRAGAQWGIGRYLYFLDETFAEVSETKPPSSSREWNYAKLSDKHGGGTYYWKSPGLPAWALPVEPGDEISTDKLNELKSAWKDKFAPECKNPAELREGFTRFVHSICGDFPVSDASCWLRESWDKCMARIAVTTNPKGVSADVPFESE